jgi:hypothetical protein
MARSPSRVGQHSINRTLVRGSVQPIDAVPGRKIRRNALDGHTHPYESSRTIAIHRIDLGTVSCVYK